MTAQKGRERDMSEIVENEAILEALAIIDQSLGKLHTRELVSSAEVSDVLLDVRSLLAALELDPDVEVASSN
jgi:hypothetical protein